MRSDLEQDTPQGTSQNLYQVQEGPTINRGPTVPTSDGHGSQTAEIVAPRFIVGVEHPDTTDSHNRDDLRRTSETKNSSRFRPLAVIVGTNATGGMIVEELRRAQRPALNIL